MPRISRYNLIGILILLVLPYTFVDSRIMDSSEKRSEFVSSQIPDWLSGWEYRKPYLVNGIPGAGTNYQIQIFLHRLTGSDYDNHVNIGTECKTDFGDIRFTDDDGVTLLDYWLEMFGNNTATIWIEVCDSLDTAQSIFIYYGNSSAISISNGTATFPLFDDFNRPDSDAVGSVWYEDEGDGQSVIENNHLKIVQNESQYCHIEQVAPSLSNFALHGKLKQHANAPDWWRMSIGAYWGSDNWIKIGWRSDSTTVDTVRADCVANPQAGGAAAVELTNLDDTWCYYKINVKSETIEFYYSLDSMTWNLVHSFTRWALLTGAPALIIIGKGHENLLTNPDYPNLDWDNDIVGDAGPEYVNYADAVFVRKIVGAESVSQPTTTNPTSPDNTDPSTTSQTDYPDDSILLAYGLITGIFIEVVVIIWLFQRKRRLGNY